MVEYHGLQGRHVIGQLYDPFYYFPSFSYAQHPDVGDVLIQCWLTSTHTRLWALDPTRNQYTGVLADHPDWFTDLGTVSQYGWLIEGVHAPAAGSADCAAADRAAAG